MATLLRQDNIVCRQTAYPESKFPQSVVRMPCGADTSTVAVKDPTCGGSKAGVMAKGAC